MIRSYKKADFPRLHQLDQLCFPPEIAYSRAELQYFITHPRCSCWIAEADSGNVAGFLIIERVRAEGRLTGHIVTLDVELASRRQGLGALLMQTAEQQMKQEGAQHLLLEVAENNAGAQRFYRRLGFIARGRINQYYGGKINADVMEKAL
jgi:[ribosomal protein S18]-alanine N-acetyltransferase